MRKITDYVLFLVTILFVLFFVGNYCPIERIIGIPCPGCGMFSALYWLIIKQNVAIALYYHPLVLLCMVYIGILLLYLVKYKNEFLHHPHIKVCSIIFFTVLCLAYILRMFLIFPDDPMVFNDQALLVRIVQLIAN